MDDSDLKIERLLDSICNEFEEHWPDGSRHLIREYLQRVEPDHRQQLLYQLLEVDVSLRKDKDEEIKADDYKEYGEDAIRHVGKRLSSTASMRSVDTGKQTPELIAKPSAEEVTMAPTNNYSSAESPAMIGRYRIEGELGRGGVWDGL